ncbi:MAG: esterase, partial [Oxalobacter sp.]|nr:esterase [Oxalobacter sp.]
MAKTLLYLHGFMSAPESFKAKVLKAVLALRTDGCHYVCPQLP